MTNEEAIKIISQYNPSLELAKACDKIKQMEMENKNPKERNKTMVGVYGRYHKNN